MIKKRSLRMIPLLLSGIVSAVCFFILCSLLYDPPFVLDDDRKSCYMASENYSKDLTELSKNLWMIGSMYYDNLTGDGKLTDNEYTTKQITEYLSGKGLLDADGKPKIGEYENLEYILNVGSVTLTNTDKSFDTLRKSGYGFCLSNGNVEHDSHYWGDSIEPCYVSADILMYKFGSETVYFYPFDTTGLPYWDNGTEIYFKTDGSTPLPPPNTTVVSSHLVYFVYEPIVTDVLQEASQLGDDEPLIFYVNSNNETSHVYDTEKNVWLSAPVKHAKHGSDISICIAPTEDAELEYQQLMQQYSEQDKNVFSIFAKCAPWGAALIVCSILFFISCGYNAEHKHFELAVFDKMYTEVTVGLAAVVLAVAFQMPIIVLKAVFRYSNPENYVGAFYDVDIFYDYRFLFAVFFGVSAICEVFLIGSLINKLKCRSFLKTCLIYKLITKYVLRFLRFCVRKLRECYCSVGRVSKNAFAVRFLIRLAVFAVIGFFMLIALAGTADAGFVIFLIAVLAAAYIFLTLRDARRLADLSERIKAVKGGDYSPREIDRYSPTYNMESDLNDITSGLSREIDERLRSEKMKIDLVTNVSHDLKTPLTSVISYVDLLSKEELPEESAAYVKILQQKTARLKAIVEDVFDLAKATSRTDVELEELDSVILLQQVLGDMEDKIDRYGGNIRTEILPQSLKVMGDGKKLYRAVQNVIDNALKYSMTGTRIYITLAEAETAAVITVKNIASYEMDFTGDEIVERFARGDKSRSSEGNGLGLSIAKSFTEACGGSFEVSPDGDVFTATIKLQKVIQT